MKVKFLGTAASEGFPAVFCNCDNCKKARELKGKNIRTRHQTLINDDLLIDLPADTYYHVLQNDLRLDKVKYLLVTHSHSDHFYPLELRSKTKPYAHNQESENLNIYGGQGVYNLYLKDNVDYDVNGYQNLVKFNLIECFKPTEIGDGYTVTSLPARHEFGKDARIYIIKKDKTVLYAHDTGIFYDEIFSYVKENCIVFDFISFDCTNVDLKWPDESSHMGFCQIERVIKKLKEIKAISNDTVMYVNHFSHNANALQNEVEKSAKKYGLKVAYDGEEIEL